MKLLIDTNIVLDVLLKREPFYQAAVKVMNLAQYDGIHEYVSASAVTDIYYIAYKHIKDRKLVLDLIKRLLMVVSIAAVTEQEIRNALETGWKDFEDAVQYSVVLLLKEGKADPDDILNARCKYQAMLDEYSEFSKKFNPPEQRERIYYDLRGRVAPSQRTYRDWKAEQADKAVQWETKKADYKCFYKISCG